MLAPDEAKERLKEFKNERGEETRLAAITALPSKLRTIGYGLLAHDKNGKRLEELHERERVKYEAAVQLDGISTKDRGRIFDVFCGKLAPYVEQLWQFGKCAPYQSGYTSRAFRAPKHPAVSLPRRAQWLLGLAAQAAVYPQDIGWFAAWAPYVSYSTGMFGALFSTAMDAGSKTGQEVFEILCASARGEHPIGAMGRHVTTALLMANRPDGWEFIERMLLAAQREEGLRQSILEAVDMAHPHALRRMLRLIVAQDLARFSSVLRAIDVWLGAGWDVSTLKPKRVNTILERLLVLMDDARARKTALAGSDPKDAYFALWAMAYDDAPATVPHAAKLLKHRDAAMRAAAARLLAMTGLTNAQLALVPCVSDPDLRVATLAVGGMGAGELWDGLIRSDLFERLSDLLPRIGAERRELPPVIWEWLKPVVSRDTVSRLLLNAIGRRPMSRLVPLLSKLDPGSRARATTMIGTESKWDGKTQEIMLDLLADPSSNVRDKALEVIDKRGLPAKQVPRIEDMLTRKAGDFRRGVLTLLLKQDDKGVLDSATRLLNAPVAEQRLGGLELLQQLHQAGRAADSAAGLEQAYRKNSGNLSDAEARLLDAFAAKAGEMATLDDALGLIDRRERTPALRPIPQVRNDRVTPAALKCLQSLDALVDQHKQTPVQVSNFANNTEETLLGSLTYGLYATPQANVPVEEDAARLLLRELWETWLKERPGDLRDADGLELVRAMAAMEAINLHTGMPIVYSRDEPAWLRELAAESAPWSDSTQPMKYPNIVHSVVVWLLRLHPPHGMPDFALDAFAFSLSRVPDEAIQKMTEPRPSELRYGDPPDWRSRPGISRWLNILRMHRGWEPAAWLPKHHARLWKLLRWMDEPIEGAQRLRCNLEEVLSAYRAGAATQADVTDNLVGTAGRYGWYHARAGSFNTLSARKPHPLFAEYPELRDWVDQLRARVLDIELQRGDLPTAATPLAQVLRWSGGLEMLERILRAHGRDGFRRSGGGWDKAGVLSHLARVTMPGNGDTPEAFASQMRAARIHERTLMDLAIFAPQWAQHVEHALGWNGLESGVWWLHAHTKDPHWRVEEELREAWRAQIAERTALTAAELVDGAVDVKWFGQAFETLGAERWKTLSDSAKYTSTGTGHARAVLFADAMIGKRTPAELAERMLKKRHQDSARALGLVPLRGEDDVPARYEQFQEFARMGKKAGAMRRANEARAIEIGMANLARTAGYADPVRLEWAMEARAAEYLAGGSISASKDDVRVTLSVNGGDPQIAVTRADKLLKAIPAAYRKAPEFAALQERKRALERQISRMRASLEAAMCRGEAFTGAELRELMRHPVLSPLLANLVFVAGEAAGCPAADGAALVAYDGATVRVLPDAAVRIAHPHDLLARKDWSAWQHTFFAASRVQPFKQIFRELYVLTGAEQGEGNRSVRYGGHQVQPRQAAALLGARGWVNNPDEGARRVFHAENIAAWLTFSQGTLTPAEVEPPVIEGVAFTRRGEWLPLPLADVPPRVFSEAMRDLDLVVSVAHAGGVDPEASQSTVEMRAALLAETLGWLKIGNVKTQGRFALIAGKLGSYSVHLGSAVVHKQPGGAICIVPVSSQHRGRVFLPFADDDPKTAEMIAKVLLLAKDTEIKDPTILEQLMR